LPEGGFSLAFRAEHAQSTRADERALRFLVRGQGGETHGGVRYAKVSFAGVDWLVAASPAGDPAPGVMLNVFVDRAHAMIFDAEGVAIDASTPSRAAS
jgi:hypothetical protein